MISLSRLSQEQDSTNSSKARPSQYLVRLSTLGQAKCRKCQEIKSKVRRGDQVDDNRFVYVEADTGHRWNGRTCHRCFVASKKKKKKKLTYWDMVKAENEANNPMTKRKCRKCSIKLRASRYFTCLKCAPDEGDDYGWTV